MSFFTYLAKAASNSDEATCHRVCMLICTLALAFSVVILAFALCIGMQDLTGAFGLATTSLGVVAGYAYGQAKKTKRETT